MKVGIIVPQGWIGDYDGWEPAQAWERTVEVALSAEALGFESLWVYDHFHTRPEPTEEITFESFSTLAHLGALTSRARLGHVVMCAGFRNPALVAKMMSTMDVQTGGRMEVGLGAGWKEEEWVAYGYRFGTARERLGALEDHLAVLTAMFAPERSYYSGHHTGVSGAINVPTSIQRPRPPIMVGGNGQEVTWRLAARYADELNLNVMTPTEVFEALPVIAARCVEIDRDPETLSVSVHVWAGDWEEPGDRRVRQLAAYQETGVARIITFIPGSPDTDEALERFAADCAAVGIELV